MFAAIAPETSSDAGWITSQAIEGLWDAIDRLGRAGRMLETLANDTTWRSQGIDALRQSLQSSREELSAVASEAGAALRELPFA